MAKQVSAEFVALFEQHHSQIAEGHVMNETFVHFADKLFAMLKEDYKTLYELEKKEHEELLAEMRPKTTWPAGGGAAAAKPPVLDTIARILESTVPAGFVGGEVTGFGGGAALCSTATNAEPQVADCALHGPMEDNDPAKGGARLCHTSNGRGYSLYSPPCNGCRMGQRDAENGLWMSGFAGKTNVFLSVRPEFQEPLHTPPHSPIAPQVPQVPQSGPALVHTPNSHGQYSLFASVGAAAPLSPIEQIPDDHF
jgi:hypothetical protein